MLDKIVLAAKAGEGIKWMLNQIPKDDKFAEEFQEKINKYIGCKYMEFSEVRPLALKVKKKLKEIYYPLSLEPIDLKSKKNKKLKIQKLEMEKMFSESSKVLIEDTAGMGKSTLMKILFLSFVEAIFEGKNSNEYIPIFIELRKYKAKESFENFIIRNFLSISDLDKIENFKNIERIKDVFFDKNIIYFFDGFDEVIVEEKSNIISEIKRFTNCYSKNFYILSSRAEEGVESFNNFFKYKISPLTFEEGLELLEKYVSSEMVDFFVQLKNNKKSLEVFLRTPLLASLIYAAYVYKNDIPTSKRDIYSRVYNALYEEHDSHSKENFVRDDLIEKEDLETILKEFSLSNIKDLKTNFTKEEMKEKIKIILQKYNLKENEKKILKVLTTGTCIFGSNGNEYFWCHKSMQEYFIAKKIKERNDKEDIIKYIINDKNNDRYYNLLSFLYEMEPILTKKIIYEVIEKEYKKHEKHSKEIQEILVVHGDMRMILLNDKQLKELETLKDGESLQKILEYLQQEGRFRSLMRRKNFILSEEKNENSIEILLNLLKEKNDKCIENRTINKEKDSVGMIKDFSVFDNIKLKTNKIYSTTNLEKYSERDEIEKVLKSLYSFGLKVNREKMKRDYKSILEKINEEKIEWL